MCHASVQKAVKTELWEKLWFCQFSLRQALSSREVPEVPFASAGQERLPAPALLIGWIGLLCPISH